MQKPSFAIAEGDGALMTDARRVDHPSLFSPLLDRLPEDIRGIKAVAAYEIPRDHPRGKGSCAACHHQQNHWNGLILELPDGTHASLGRICGENKHGYKHRELIKAFDQGTSRGEALRRAVLAIDQLLPAVEHLVALPNLPQIAALEEFRNSFESRFGKLYRNLQGANGRLYLNVWVTDDERMIARKKRRDAAADRYAERVKEKTGREPTRAEVESHFAGDEDFSTEVLRRREERQAATFTGSFFFTKFGRLTSESNSIVGRMQRALSPLDGVTSDKILTVALQAAVRQFVQAIADGIDLIDNLNAAATIISPANLGEIVRWANRRPDVGIGGTYGVKPGALVCDFPSGPPRKLHFPEVFPAISQGSLPAIHGLFNKIEVDHLVADSSVVA